MTIEIWVQKLWIGVKFMLFLETADQLNRRKAVANFPFWLQSNDDVFFIPFHLVLNVVRRHENPVQFNASNVINEQKVELYDGITIDKIKGVRDRNTHTHAVRQKGTGGSNSNTCVWFCHTIQYIQLKFISHSIVCNEREICTDGFDRFESHRIAS